MIHESSPTPRLVIKGMRKVYPAVVANDNVDLTVMPGEIHAVVGENGAGKSTLMKAIYGAIRPDAGEIRWEGKAVAIRNPAHARELGIGMVFQHFSLFETLTVVQNVALALPGKFDLAGLARRITEVSDRYGLPIDPRRLVHALSVGERQRVEIIRCLLQEPRLLILDEPTSVLTPQAVRKLFETLRQLAAEGCSILYISHKLDEIQELCHTATILRGRQGHRHLHALPGDPQDHGPDDDRRGPPGHPPRRARRRRRSAPAHRRAVPRGRGPVRHQPKEHAPGGAQRRDRGHRRGVRQRPAGTAQGHLRGAAPDGAQGRAGVRRPGRTHGPGPAPRPGHVLRAGGAPGPGRGAQAHPHRERPAHGPPQGHAGQRHDQAPARPGASPRNASPASTCSCGGAGSEAKSLSGGNLQKFIVGREIMQEPKLLVLAQPTWGVDVGAASFIRRSLLELRAKGTAILVISEELDELFEICDRLVVIAKGTLSPAKVTSQTGVEEIGIWMSGMWPESAAAGEPTHVA